MPDAAKDKSIDQIAKKTPPDTTEGSVLGSILKMGVPSMIGFGIGNIYSLVDTWWLSKLGPEPVAALTILGPMLWVAHSANHIVGVGSVAIISRRYGEKEYLKTEMAIKETILLKWLAAILFSVFGYFASPPVIAMLGAKGQVLEMAIVYARIIFIGLGFNFATYSVFTAMRGIANPNLAMGLMIGLSVFNMILDPFMIFGWWIFPEMGVAGAAWASVISYALAFGLGMIFLTNGMTNIRLRFHSEGKLSWKTMWQILKIGAPSAVGQVSFSAARMIIMPMIAMFGTGVVAAYGVSQQVGHIGIMLLVGIGLGLSALIGHNLGAEKYDRAKKIASQAILIAIGIMSVIGLVTAGLAKQIMGMFFEDPAIIGHGVTILRILAIASPFLGMWLMIENIYSGVGENRPAMVFNIIHAWILEIPAIAICIYVFDLDQTAVWWAITVAMIVNSIALYFYYRRGGWLKVKV
ncbi:MAG: MATE family efflux transporter [candidate division Zixibacteria bacterium]|nr:MATE family efflux transporter [candidate division Zixibacteria bacterium]